MSNNLDLEINVLSDVKGSLEKNIEKISIQVIEDTKLMEGAQPPCNQISTFVNNIITIKLVQPGTAPPLK